MQFGSLIVEESNQEFVLSCIVKPGLKVYFRDNLGDKVYAVQNINRAFKFYNRVNAFSMANSLDEVYGVTFSVESVGV